MFPDGLNVFYFDVLMKKWFKFQGILFSGGVLWLCDGGGCFLFCFFFFFFLKRKKETMKLVLKVRWRNCLFLSLQLSVTGWAAQVHIPYSADQPGCRPILQLLYSAIFVSFFFSFLFFLSSFATSFFLCFVLFFFFFFVSLASFLFFFSPRLIYSNCLKKTINYSYVLQNELLLKVIKLIIGIFSNERWKQSY